MYNTVNEWYKTFGKYYDEYNELWDAKKDKLAQTLKPMNL